MNVTLFQSIFHQVYLFDPWKLIKGTLVEGLELISQTIVDEGNDIIIVTKADFIEPPGPEIVYVNRAFTKVTGYSPEEAIGINPRFLQTAATSIEARKKIRKALTNMQSVRVEINNFSKIGQEYWLDLCILPLRKKEGGVSFFASIARDITEQKNSRHELELLSRIDPLTGRFNRRAFEEICLNEFSRYSRTGEKYSLLIIDLDHFKSINDRYGHASGDIALKSFVELYSSNIRKHDAIARLGGDEFCIALPYTNELAAKGIAEKLLSSISAARIHLKLQEITITASIGVTEVSIDDTHHLQALERADNALYKAKKIWQESCQ